ncbi:hypothetical protein K431DRAFT_81096 [Polychaeton citri CBS 116435]|uniref:Uncharacterized protein n=1 Tax=Polychaeton citri CBS 116435 TaxID=1314669 RepID=A0A9P4QJ03_9PEZI|nr:hypothetical protein K431DRAFT_81096 [Polychaeton citri CBS 116435]
MAIVSARRDDRGCLAAQDGDSGDDGDGDGDDSSQRVPRQGKGRDGMGRVAWALLRCALWSATDHWDGGLLLYTVRCTLYAVRCTLYTVHYTLGAGIHGLRHTSSARAAAELTGRGQPADSAVHSAIPRTFALPLLLFAFPRLLLLFSLVLPGSLARGFSRRETSAMDTATSRCLPGESAVREANPTIRGGLRVGWLGARYKPPDTNITL